MINATPCSAQPGVALGHARQPQPQGSGTTYSDADPTTTSARRPRTAHRRRQRSRWAARTSATCSTQPTSPGAGSRADSRARDTSPASRRPTICQRSARERTRTSPGLGRDYIPHHEPFRVLRLDGQPAAPAADVDRGRSATRTRPTTSTTSVTSGRPLTAATCPRSPTSRRPPLPGRPRRLLRPARRAAVSGQHHQPPGEAPHHGAARRSSINWDDSDGWYDHQIGPIVTQSQTSLDAPDRTRPVRSNPACRGPPRGSRPAAVSARGSRCWSSRLTQDELRRRHVHHADLGRPLHRGQLARRPADRRGLGGCNHGQPGRDVQLPTVACPSPVPEPRNGRADRTHAGCADRSSGSRALTLGTRR